MKALESVMDGLECGEGAIDLLPFILEKDGGDLMKGLRDGNLSALHVER